MNGRTGISPLHVEKKMINEKFFILKKRDPIIIPSATILQTSEDENNCDDDCNCIDDVLCDEELFTAEKIEDVKWTEKFRKSSSQPRLPQSQIIVDMQPHDNTTKIPINVPNKYPKKLSSTKVLRFSSQEYSDGDQTAQKNITSEIEAFKPSKIRKNKCSRSSAHLKMSLIQIRNNQKKEKVFPKISAPKNTRKTSRKNEKDDKNIMTGSASDLPLVSPTEMKIPINSTKLCDESNTGRSSAKDNVLKTMTISGYQHCSNCSKLQQREDRMGSQRVQKAALRTNDFYQLISSRSNGRNLLNISKTDQPMNEGLYRNISLSNPITTMVKHSMLNCASEIGIAKSGFHSALSRSRLGI